MRARDLFSLVIDLHSLLKEKLSVIDVHSLFSERQVGCYDLHS